jgi:hypothetical protein
MFGPIVRVCKSINKRRMYGRSSSLLELSASGLNGFVQGNECVLRLVLDRELEIFLDLVLEGGYGAQCTDLLSSAKLESVA